MDFTSETGYTRKYPFRRHYKDVTQFTEGGLRTTPPKPKKVAPPGDRTYFAPTIGGIAIDWCKYWGTQCGQPAADEFCRRESYRRAKSWAKNENPLCAQDVCKTRIITNYSQVCHAKYCRGFLSIICTHDRDCQTQSWVLDTEHKYCEWGKSLIVKGKEGAVSLESVPSRTNYQLGIPVTPKFTWYCGGSKQIMSCPSDTNVVDASRWLYLDKQLKNEPNVEFRCRHLLQVCK